MKVRRASPRKHFARTRIERDVDEELSFNLDLLTPEHLRQDRSGDDAALKRFGNVEQIKDQCVEISTSNRPLTKALKAFLIPVFLLGVLVRVYSTEFPFSHFGNSLILVAVLGRLFLYVRGLNPSSFSTKPENSSPLMLTKPSHTPIADYQHNDLTPLQRVISDK
jgi:hypothetical protein